MSGAAGKSAGRKGKSPPSTAEKASDTGELDFTSPSEVPLQTVVKQTEGELEMLRAQVAAQQSIIEQLINSASEKGFDTPTGTATPTQADGPTAASEGERSDIPGIDKVFETHPRAWTAEMLSKFIMNASTTRRLAKIRERKTRTHGNSSSVRK